MTCKEIKEFLDKEAGFDISEKRRLMEFLKFRWLYYYFCFRYASDAYSYNMVGKHINVHHATVIHGIATFKDYHDTDKDFNNLVSKIDLKIKSLVPKKQLYEIMKLESMNNIRLKNVIKRQKKRIERLENRNKKFAS